MVLVPQSGIRAVAQAPQLEAEAVAGEAGEAVVPVV